jgi:hypothetical protein
MMTVAEIYEKHIKPLPLDERLELVERIKREADAGEEKAEPKHSIMELHGLGAEIWQGINAQEYIDEMRDEWDEPR